MLPGHATAEATAAYAARFPALAEAGHFRAAKGVGAESWMVSSLGLGTYLGEADNATDAGYQAAIEAALASGINVLDTAINYRHQRSERVLGQALASGRCRREEIVVCTKAGFFPFDSVMPADPRAYILATYVQPGLAHPGQIAAGAHCMAPVYLADQLHRSRQNLGLETIDVFYLHNPETQAAGLSREEFYRRLREAFAFLEKAVANGLIRYYGAATWSGFRVPPDHGEYLELSRMAALAREAGGEQHHFRFIQLPYNLQMPEASVLMNQPLEKPPYVSLLGAAARLKINVVASASLAAGQLAGMGTDALEYLRPFLVPAESAAECALQFTRAGVVTALAGMARAEHVAANLRVAAWPPPSAVQISRLLRQ
ncbi:MAG: aldo/keto reductase [Terriglobales bacterium]